MSLGCFPAVRFMNLCFTCRTQIARRETKEIYQFLLFLTETLNNHFKADNEVDKTFHRCHDYAARTDIRHKAKDKLIYCF